MRFYLLLALAALAGCATSSPTMRVTYDSDPKGATLYQNGQPMGTTPVTLQYQTDPAFRKGGCKQLTGTEVKWASGVTASVPSLQACASAGYAQRFTFVRPDVPGREVDANFALQLQRNHIMQSANEIQLMNATKPASAVRCTSRQVGFTVRTICQ